MQCESAPWWRCECFFCRVTMAQTWMYLGSWVASRRKAYPTPPRMINRRERVCLKANLLYGRLLHGLHSITDGSAQCMFEWGGYVITTTLTVKLQQYIVKARGNFPTTDPSHGAKNMLSLANTHVLPLPVWPNAKHLWCCSRYLRMSCWRLAQAFTQFYTYLEYIPYFYIVYS